MTHTKTSSTAITLLSIVWLAWLSTWTAVSAQPIVQPEIKPEIKTFLRLTMSNDGGPARGWAMDNARLGLGETTTMRVTLTDCNGVSAGPESPSTN